MNKEVIDKIIELRKQTLGYGAIAKELNIQTKKVAYYCRKYGLGGELASEIDYGDGVCEKCGKKFSKRMSHQKYCNGKCARDVYWSSDKRKQYNKEYRERTKVFYKCTCLNCGIEFENTNKNKKYCSDKCSKQYHSKKAWDKKRKPKEKQCQYCNKEFIDDSKFNTKTYCSKECHKIWMNENPRNTKICPECNKEYKTNWKEQKYCSKECSGKATYTYKDVFNTGRYVATEEKEIKERIKNRYPKFEYIGNYTGVDGAIDLKCNDCGYEFTRNGQLLKPSFDKIVICHKCEEIETEKRKIERKILKQKKKQEKEKARIERLERLEAEKLAKIKTVECAECGRKFETKNAKCCSKECSKKRLNRNKDKRIYKNGKPDLSITLTKLIKRDKNICHICGEKCNDEDFYYKDTFFIAGEDYPSIDHIVPIAKGGEHKWENIKLAHRRCNNKKRDSLIYTAKDNQLMFTI